MILSLLLTSLFLVMGIGFLSQRAAQNRASKAAQARFQARALAEAGLEDAAIKLAKRSNFPPLADETQRVFRYTERLSDGAGVEVGTYIVAVDMTRAGEPYFIVRLTSTGRVGPAEEPLAELTLSGELDVSSLIRETAIRRPEPNPNRYRFLYLAEGDTNL